MNKRLILLGLAILFGCVSIATGIFGAYFVTAETPGGPGERLPENSPFLRDKVVKVVSAKNTNFVIDENNVLWGWGENRFGLLGDGTRRDRWAPFRIGDGFTDVSASETHVLALKGTELYVWGTGVFGTLGDEGKSPYGSSWWHEAEMNFGWGMNFGGGWNLWTVTKPYHLGSGYSQISAGTFYSMAIKGNGDLYSWGRDMHSRWSGSGIGTLGISDVWQIPTPRLVGSGFAQVSAGVDHTLAISTSGELWGWGNTTNQKLPSTWWVNQSEDVKMNLTEYFEFGYTYEDSWEIDEEIPFRGFSKVFARKNHSFVLMHCGRLWLIGDNFSGQSATGHSGSGEFSEPWLVGTGFTDFWSGSWHFMGLKGDNLYTWGSNAFGQLGDGTEEMKAVPVLVGNGFSLVSGDGNHTIAIKTDGTLWAWGANYYGQLGNMRPGDYSSNIPERVLSVYDAMLHAIEEHREAVNQLAVLLEALEEALELGDVDDVEIDALIETIKEEINNMASEIDRLDELNEEWWRIVEELEEASRIQHEQLIEQAEEIEELLKELAELKAQGNRMTFNTLALVFGVISAALTIILIWISAALVKEKNKAILK